MSQSKTAKSVKELCNEEAEEFCELCDEYFN